MTFVRRVLVILLVLGVLTGIAAAGGAYYFYQLIAADLPSLESLEDYAPPLTSVVYDRKGRPIGEFFDERRQITPAGEIPKLVVQAFVAAEDDTFFEHSGIDYLSIVRAAWVNFSAGGKIKQGASTITQQVAKSLVGNEKSYVRKLKDMLLAKRIEERFTKEQILYLYLNQIYFGHGAYGVAEAARSYYGKKLGDLTVSEAAMIAGLPKAPTDYSPMVNPAAAEQRRLYVLDRMRAQGFIDRATWEQAVAERPALRDPREYADYAAAAGFTEEVRRTLYKQLGSARVLRGGLRIETTVDLDLQRDAVLSVQRGLEAYERRHGGWRGPERTVAPSQIEATIAELGRQNGLVPVAPTQVIEVPENRSLLGVVTSVDAARARFALAPGVEGAVALEDAAWAFKPAWKKHGDARGLDRLLKVGDVARFALRPPPRPITKPAAPAPTNAAPPPPPPAAPEDGEEGPETLQAAALPPVSAGPDAARALRWELNQVPKVEGALLSLDVGTGSVLAMVGGYDFERSEFNRTTQARRQPGSAFKAFLYGAAVEAGFTPTTIVMDSPITLWDVGSMQYWSPKNYKNIYKGAVPVKEAIARSLNNAAVNVFLEVGVDPVIDYARRLGVRSPLGRHLSLALGSTELPLVELVRAYGTFASGGTLLQPVFVRRVLSREGTTLAENIVLEELDAPPPPKPAAPASAKNAPPPPPPEPDPTGFVLPSQGLPPDEAFMMTYLLRQPVENPHGTAHKAADLGRPLAGKTGTTNEQNDAWFIGFSPEVVTGVWVGFDQKKMLGDKETGGRAALPIWIDYMNTALADRPASDFPMPAGIEFRRVGGVEVVSGGGEEEEGAVQQVTHTTPVSYEPFLTRVIARKQRGAATGEEGEEEGGEVKSSYDLLREEAF